MKPRFADNSPAQAAVAYEEALDHINKASGGDASQVYKKTGIGREVYAALLWGMGNCHISIASASSWRKLDAMRGFTAIQNASMVYTKEEFPLTFAKILPDWEAARKVALSS
jgi:hypothetical protein